MNKKLLLGAVLLALIVGFGLTNVPKVHAQEESSWLPPIIQNFVDRFNLDQDEVDEFVQEQQEQRQQEMQDRREEHLNQLVEEGKLTEEQRSLLEQKMEERWQEKEQEREEWQNWLQENNIELTGLGFGPRGPGAGGPCHSDL